MKNKWYYPLVNILKMIGIDIAAFIIGVVIDSALTDHTTELIGHGGPGVTSIIIIVFGAISIVVIALSLVKTVLNLFRKNDNHRYDKETGVYIPASPKNYLWMIPAQLVLDIIIFIISFKIDEANYSPPEHGGFMVPIVTIMAIFVFGIITVIICIASIAMTANSKKKYRTPTQN